MAASAGEALEVLRSPAPFDLALLDLHLPGLDGVALAHAIRQMRNRDKLGLVLLAAPGRQPALPPGLFAAQVSKPLKPAALYETLLGTLAGQLPQRPLSEPVFDSQLARRYPLRLLLAEDYVVNRKVALRLLERLGYHADVAANGLEVLDALRRQPYDVVLMDVQMPELDGLETSRRIRAEFPAERQPRIVAMTANVRQSDREQCLAAGMDDFLGKPVRVEALSRVLRQSYRGEAPTGEAPTGEAPTGETPTGEALPEAAPASGPFSPAAEVLDARLFEQFQEVMGKDQPGALAEVLTTYLEETSRQLARLKAGLAEEADAAGLERLAHSLKSSSALIGALSFSRLCRELELAISEAQSLPAAREVLVRVEAGYAQLRAALEAELRRLHA